MAAFRCSRMMYDGVCMPGLGMCAYAGDRIQRMYSTDAVHFVYRILRAVAVEHLRGSQDQEISWSPVADFANGLNQVLYSR